MARGGKSVVLARRGDAEDADRISTEGVAIADGTDSFDAETAWLARALVLSILGRRAEAREAASRSRDLFAAKGFVNGIRRAEALLAWMSLVVADAPERQRFEAQLDGTFVGVLVYAVADGRIDLIHTEVFPEFEGHGIAAALTRFALDDARRRGLRVIPSCPYVRRYLESHPEDLDIVVEAPTS